MDKKRFQVEAGSCVSLGKKLKKDHQYYMGELLLVK